VLAAEPSSGSEVLVEKRHHETERVAHASIETVEVAGAFDDVNFAGVASHGVEVRRSRTRTFRRPVVVEPRDTQRSRIRNVSEAACKGEAKRLIVVDFDSVSDPLRIGHAQRGEARASRTPASAHESDDWEKPWSNTTARPEPRVR
jgi:hypothetical protein